MDVSGRCAIVTGAGAGSGRAIALRLAAEGALVLVADLDEQAADATAKEIADAGGRAVAVVVDMREPASIEQLLRLAEDQPVPFGVLINNAGGGGDKPPHFPRACDLESKGRLESDRADVRRAISRPIYECGRGRGREYCLESGTRPYSLRFS